MKKFRSFLIQTAFISAVFLFSINIAFAETPSLSYVKLSGVSDNITFNPNQGKLSIEILANKPVKFNTIAVCKTAEEVCSRSKAVKYFTNYDMLPSVTKEWDGKTGGSSPVLVDAGDYKLSITMDDGENDPVTEISSHIITVNFSSDSSGGFSTTSSEEILSSGISSSGASAHSGSESISTYKEPTGIFEVSAGRERVVYVGNPVIFTEKHKASSDLTSQYQTYSWSLGDGSLKEGPKITHTYMFPGEHIVVLNATCGQYTSISRTVVKVLAPEILLGVVEGGFEIENKGKYEINLGGWKIETPVGQFIIPNDTIIGEKKKIIIPFEYANIKDNTVFEYFLKDTRAKIVAEYKKTEMLALNTVSSTKPETSYKPVTISTNSNIPNIKIETNVVTSTGMISSVTTTVASGSVKTGIIKKAISLPVSGIRAIKDTFYGGE